MGKVLIFVYGFVSYLVFFAAFLLRLAALPPRSEGFSIRRWGGCRFRVDRNNHNQDLGFERTLATRRVRIITE